MDKEIRVSFESEGNIRGIVKGEQGIKVALKGATSVAETDYDALINKPLIESIELIGNKTFDDLGLKGITEQEIRNLF